MLLMLSVKVSVLVYESYNSTNLFSDEISFVDIEETENEEQEIDEHQKIPSKLSNVKVKPYKATQTPMLNARDHYNSWHLEYTTPPPEHI